jgi:hypothetical protein
LAVASIAAAVWRLLVATIPYSHAGSASASVVARTRPTSSLSPEIRSPRSFMAST